MPALPSPGCLKLFFALDAGMRRPFLDGFGGHRFSVVYPQTVGLFVSPGSI